MADVLSVGATLTYDTTNTVGGIKQISGPDGDTVDINTTDYDNEDRFQTFIAGMTDAGEVTVTVKFDPSTFADLYAIVGETKDWQIDLVDGSTLAWSGYLKMPSFEYEEADDDGLVTNELTIKISGKPTFTAAA